MNEAREQKRRALEPLEQRRKAMARQQRDERVNLDHKQKAKQEQEARDRSARLYSGMKGLWQRLTGDYARTRKQNEQEAYAAFQRDREQRETLIFAQMDKRRDLQRQIKVVRKRHAALFREIRQDQQHYRQMERDTAPPASQRSFRQVSPDRAGLRAPTTTERLERLRTQKPIQNSRDKGPERER